LAPGTAAPEESVTVPVILANVDCAAAVVQRKNTKTAAVVTIFHGMPDTQPPENDDFTLLKRDIVHLLGTSLRISLSHHPHGAWALELNALGSAAMFTPCLGYIRTQTISNVKTLFARGRRSQSLIFRFFERLIPTV
jgi:hypothetical protein